MYSVHVNTGMNVYISSLCMNLAMLCSLQLSTSYECIQVSASPMRNILRRLQFQNYISIAHFSDDVILNKPIEEWPLCDCLIAFYSKGFPLDKAIAYVNLRHPFVINDLEMQYSLMDR